MRWFLLIALLLIPTIAKSDSKYKCVFSPSDIICFAQESYKEQDKNPNTGLGTWRRGFVVYIVMDLVAHIISKKQPQQNIQISFADGFRYTITVKNAFDCLIYTPDLNSATQCILHGIKSGRVT